MKKLWIKIVLAIIILLALTNPTVKDLKESTGKNGLRTGYFLVFSIYTVTPHDIFGNESGHSEKYIGIFKNFIEIED